MEPVAYKAATEEAAIQHFVDKERWPEAIRQRYVDLIKTKLSELQAACAEGDAVWICRSRYIGPFAGHEGLGIVRGDEVVRCDVLIDY